MQSSNFHHSFHLFFDGLGLPPQSGNGPEHMTLGPQIGGGGIRRFIPRPDLEVVLSELRFTRDFTLPIETKTPMVEIHYGLQGSRQVRIENRQYEFVPDMCSLQLIREAKTRFEFGGNQSYLMLAIGLPVASFHHFMEDLSGTRKVDFFSLLGRKPFRLFQEAIDPAATIVLNRLRQALQTPGTRKLEVECCALELLLSSFQSFLIGEKPLKLSARDTPKIRQARDIIMERMADPPSLVQLSRMVGLNDFKLKIGFKEMYGTTVYGYLREKRLEKALLLLQQGELNVNETSLAIGYSNPSYFSEAFRAKYGVNPGSLNRRSGLK